MSFIRPKFTFLITHFFVSNHLFILSLPFQARFEQMLQDFKEQGSTVEQLEEMTTPERYERYKELSKPNVEKVVKLGMAFRDIAEKEKLSASKKEIQDQYDMLCAQSRQKGEQPPDERRAKDETENVLLRKKVFDFIAENGIVTWVDSDEEVPPPEPIVPMHDGDAQ